MVGSLEVFSVGALDGFVEGRTFSEKEGFTEGIWLGRVLGSKVGVVEIEGKEEGSALSFFVGTIDEEGNIDATLVGSIECTCVGTKLGNKLGPLDGRAEGILRSFCPGNMSRIPFLSFNE